MEKILLIENEENLTRFIASELQKEGFKTESSLDGQAGYKIYQQQSQSFDLILLDSDLPSLNGIDICCRIREESTLPIILMMETDAVIDCVSALDKGADDYIVKPFAIEELIARIHAIFRRIAFEHGQTANDNQITTYRDLRIERDSRLVRRNEEIIPLTPREYEIFMQLLEHNNQVQSRQMLLETVWGYKSDVETNIVDVYIRYLRNKLDVSGRDSYIQTVRGIGYIMRPEDEVRKKA